MQVNKYFHWDTTDWPFSSYTSFKTILSRVEYSGVDVGKSGVIQIRGLKTSSKAAYQARAVQVRNFVGIQSIRGSIHR